MKEILESLGLYPLFSEPIQTPNQGVEYLVNDLPRIAVHKEFLKSMEEKEENRLNLIENKTAQLVSQAGMIFSLLGLFIPIFIDKVSEQALFIRIVFLMLLIFSFLFYMLTIHNAMKNLNIWKFRYSKPAASNVPNFQNLSPEEFSAMEVRDLLYSINNNTNINNAKGNNLLHAFNAFKIANTLTAILGLSICVSLLFMHPAKSSMRIENPLEIKGLDTVMRHILEKPKGGCELQVGSIGNFKDSSK